jgi:hypothetical protein
MGGTSLAIGGAMGFGGTLRKGFSLVGTADRPELERTDEGLDETSGEVDGGWGPNTTLETPGRDVRLLVDSNGGMWGAHGGVTNVGTVEGNFIFFYLFFFF